MRELFHPTSGFIYLKNEYQSLTHESLYSLPLPSYIKTKVVLKIDFHDRFTIALLWVINRELMGK